MHKVTFTHFDKVFWPESGITKGDLINYYSAVSKYLLPHIADRPESMNRYPNGITGEHFFQKNITQHPPWLETFNDYLSEADHPVNYALCHKLEDLLYLINLGCVDLNVWSSKAKTSDEPDFVVFDLDPLEIGFDSVIAVALAIRDELAKLNIESYPKTTGKTGIHIYIPLAPGHTYEQSEKFSHLIAIIVHQKLPETTSLERLTKNRKGKVYLDYLQNRRGATMASPYCVRPVRCACVSAPITWSELEKGIKPSDFTIKNMPKRLEKYGDIFAPVLKKGIEIEKALERLSRLAK